MLTPWPGVQDHVTISFDGQDREGIFAAVTEKLKKMSGASPGLLYYYSEELSTIYLHGRQMGWW